MIYFIRSGGSGFVKVGFSHDPQRRLQELQTGNPETLWIEAMMDGDMTLERRLHIALKEFATRGEWFDVSSEDLEPVIRRFRQEDTFDGQ